MPHDSQETAKCFGVDGSHRIFYHKRRSRRIDVRPSRTFLLEIGVEELPVWAVISGLKQLKVVFEKLFQDIRLPVDDLRVMETPRRLALQAHVAPRQEVWEEVVQGPPLNVARKNDTWTQAAYGFASRYGLSAEELQVEKRGKGVYVVARVRRGGKDVQDLLKEHLPDLLQTLQFEKSMRWNGKGIRFPRPIRWLVALLDEEVLPFSFAGLQAGRRSFGHRAHRSTVEIPHAAAYEAVMEEVGVVVDPLERKQRLREQILKCVREADLRWIEDDELLEENTHLLEFPGVLMGHFDQGFLDLPEVVILTALKQHQRYFGARTSDNTLAPVFLAPVNLPGSPDTVREGMERVVRARLEDAAFYFKEDMKIPLKERIPLLKGVYWVEKLGTLYDKTCRIVTLSQWIARQVQADLAVVEEGAWLAKVDQTTLMIRDGKEFTKLEGRIGMEYALRQGYPEPVARILYEHHLPRGEEMPKTVEGAVVGVGDRIDTLVGFFAMGERAKGSRDPFGLRRDAVAVFDLILHFGMSLNLSKLLEKSLELYPEKWRKKEVLEDLLSFLRDRFERYLEEKAGIRYDIVDAVMVGGNWDLVDVYARARALQNLLDQDEERFTAVVVGLKRVANILKGRDVGDVPDPAQFKMEEEKALWEALHQIDAPLKEALQKRDYPRALEVLFSLRPWIDRFFDHVFVMVEDESVRDNRLRLLRAVRDRFAQYADLSKIVVRGG